MGYIYLDSRESEKPGYEDATGFCRAVSRLAGLALANLKRADLQRRQDKMDVDLEAARHAQAFLWPSNEGVVGKVKYAMRMTPGRIVAGDLFDILLQDLHPFYLGGVEDPHKRFFGREPLFHILSW